MAFQLSSPLNEIRIFDEKSGSTQILYARDPSPQEQLAYDRERVIQRRGKTLNRIRQTRLKYGCRVLDHPQTAATSNPKDDGYGFYQDGQWQPLTADTATVPVDRETVQAEYAKAYGAEWARWIAELPPWKVLLLACASQHVERVGSVIFDGAADYKQAMGEEGEEEGEDDERQEESLGN